MIKAWSLSAISSSERNKRVVICVFCSIAFPDVYLRLPLYMISFGFFLWCLQDAISRLHQEDVHEI